jgi:hypothetical protein
MFDNICMGKIPPPHKKAFFGFQNYHMAYDIINYIQRTLLNIDLSSFKSQTKVEVNCTI